MAGGDEDLPMVPVGIDRPYFRLNGVATGDLLFLMLDVHTAIAKALADRLDDRTGFELGVVFASLRRFDTTEVRIKLGGDLNIIHVNIDMRAPLPHLGIRGRCWRLNVHSVLHVDQDLTF